MNDILAASHPDQSDEATSMRRKPYTPPACIDLSAQATQGKIYSTKESPGYFGSTYGPS